MYISHHPQGVPTHQRYVLIVIRGIVLKGVEPPIIWQEVISLAVFSLAMLAAASAHFRKSLD